MQGLRESWSANKFRILGSEETALLVDRKNLSLIATLIWQQVACWHCFGVVLRGNGIALAQSVPNNALQDGVGR